MRKSTAHEVTKHHAPDQEGIDKITKIRQAAETMVGTLLAECPPSADRTTAIRCARLAMMWGNASVVVPQNEVTNLSSELGL
jgi:hypothetical protein